MRLLMLGFNHRTAPLELREALAFDPTRAINDLRGAYASSECAVLSTCNRTELYLARPAHDPPTVEDLRRFVAQQTSVKPDAVTTASIHREQEQAALHLFRVCTGLDSMVLGEPQILGQVKRAYEAADQLGSVGPVLHRLFQGAITAAKQARAQTGIDQGRTSISSVAVDFARNIFDHFHDKTVLFIGAGEMIKTTVHHMKRLDPGKMWIINRSLDNAAALAQTLDLNGAARGARAWDDLEELLVEADIVVSCTAANEPILTAARFKPLVRRRRNRPLFLIDMAMPRDIEPRVGSFNNVYLYNLDDLLKTVEATTQGRRDQVGACEAILADHVERCMGEIRHRDVGRLVKQLRTRLADIAQAEHDRTARKLAALNGSAEEAHLEKLLQQHNHRLINKILHLPLSQLDRRDPDASLGFYAAALRRLFDLHDQPDMPAEATTEEKTENG
ncbi:MAG: glutamyl-tRNA reductase [Planctomycetota bacterium]